MAEKSKAAVKLRDIRNRDLARLAEAAGTTYGYLLRVKYGQVCAGTDMARRIEEAAGRLGLGYIPRWSLVSERTRAQLVSFMG